MAKHLDKTKDTEGKLGKRKTYRWSLTQGTTNNTSPFTTSDCDIIIWKDWKEEMRKAEFKSPKVIKRLKVYIIINK